MGAFGHPGRKSPPGIIIPTAGIPATCSHLPPNDFSQGREMGERKRGICVSPFISGKLCFLYLVILVSLSPASGENMNSFQHVSLERDGLSHLALIKEAAFPNKIVIYCPYQMGISFLWSAHYSGSKGDGQSHGSPSVTPCPYCGLRGCALLQSPLISLDAKSEVEISENEATRNRHESTTFSPIWGNHCIGTSLWHSPGHHPHPHIHLQSSSSSIDVITVSFSGKWSGSLHCRVAYWSWPEINSASQCMHHFYKTSLFWNSKWHV